MHDMFYQQMSRNLDSFYCVPLNYRGANKYIINDVFFHNIFSVLFRELVDAGQRACFLGTASSRRPGAGFRRDALLEAGPSYH